MSNQMTFFFLLFGTDNLLLIWLFEYRITLNKKECFLLSVQLLCSLLFSLFLPLIYLLILYSIYELFKIYFINQRFNTWIVSVLSVIKNYTLLAILWLISYDIPKILLTLHLFKDIEKKVGLIIGQLLFLLITHYIFMYAIDKYNVLAILSSVRKRYRLLSMATLTIFLFLAFVHTYYYYPKYINSFVFSFSLLLMGAIVFCLYFFLISKAYYDERSNNLLASTIQTMNKNYESSREFKHDYKNILNSLYKYLENEEWQNAKEYLEQIIDYSYPILAAEFHLQILSLPILPMQSILIIFCEKLLANQQHTKLLLTVKQGSYQVGMNLVDLSRCFSIMLDNAAEATQLLSEATIKIDIFEANNTTYFNVKNTASTLEPLTKILNKNFSTKQNHSGQGLYILNKIISEYNNVDYTIDIEQDSFLLSLSIDNKKKG